MHKCRSILLQHWHINHCSYFVISKRIVSGLSQKIENFEIMLFLQSLLYPQQWVDRRFLLILNYKVFGRSFNTIDSYTMSRLLIFDLVQQKEKYLVYGVLQFFQEVTIDIKHSGFDNILTTSFCLCHSVKILIKILFEWIFLFLKLKYLVRQMALYL